MDLYWRSIFDQYTVLFRFIWAYGLRPKRTKMTFKTQNYRVRKIGIQAIVIPRLVKIQFSIFRFQNFKKPKKILKDFRKCSSQKIFSKNIFRKIFFRKYFRKKYSRKYNFFYFQYFFDRIEVLESLSTLVSTKMRVYVV